MGYIGRTNEIGFTKSYKMYVHLDGHYVSYFGYFFSTNINFVSSTTILYLTE